MRTLTDRARKYFGVSDRYPHNPETLHGALSGELGFSSLEIRLLPKPPRGRTHRSSDRLQARCPACKKWFGTGNLEQHVIVHGVGSEGALRHHAHLKERGYPEALREHHERVAAKATQRDKSARYCIWMGARRRYFDSLEEAKRFANEVHRRTGVIVGIENAPARGHKRDPQKTVTMTVYAATIWWRDSDPLMTVVAKTAAKAKALAFKAMKEEAKQAYDSDQFDKLSQAQDALAWSGVHVFDLTTLAHGSEYEEALSDLKTRGYAYLSGH